MPTTSRAYLIGLGQTRHTSLAETEGEPGGGPRGYEPSVPHPPMNHAWFTEVLFPRVLSGF